MADAQMSPGAIYAQVRDELIAAVSGLDDATASHIVPACPAWTVKDVIGHVCGLNAEKLGGVTGSLGSDESTTRQVADRASHSLSQIIDEWTSLAEPIGEFMAGEPVVAAAFLADLVIHAYDLAEVLGQDTTAAAAATPLSAKRYVPLLQERVAERVSIALGVELTDGATWPAPAGSPERHITVRATSHEFLRGVTGRLTRSQVESFAWSMDPTAILDIAWNQYGSYRV